MIRIAVIGGGPKSLFALLALNDSLPPTAVPQVTVDVYDPQLPGAGSVWRTDQPAVLRLNVKASIVDASSSLSSENFAQWVTRVVPEISGETYPPRAVVGRYLQEQFQRLLQHGNMALTHKPFVATGVERVGAQWRVSGAFGEQYYDEVLLATGHGVATAAAAQPLLGAINTHPLIGDYTTLTAADIPAESQVWIRGAALTAYDVALLLTEGSGGSWQFYSKNAGGNLTQVRYLASGKEPRSIVLASRSGTLMDPKSETVPAELSAALTQYQQQLSQWGSSARQAMSDGEVKLGGMWTVLLHCAQDCARLMGDTVSALALWRTALTGLSVEARPSATASSSTVGAAADLRKSLAVNDCKAPLTTGWLWARVWSGLYAELVSVLDRLPRSTQDGREFARVARNLERFAFGPPELTARKLVALFDAGILHVATAGERPPPEAVLIDAVTPRPGVLDSAAPEGRPSSELMERLLHAGYISIRPGDRGLLTDPDGTCVAPDGTRSGSLSALGRPTEDPTLGHDTLNRSLHLDYFRWAQRIAARHIDQLDT